MVSVAPQGTSPTTTVFMEPGGETVETGRSLEVDIDGADDTATGNEILDRFLLNLNDAQRPIKDSGSSRGVNSLDNVHDLRFAIPKTLYTHIGKSSMPPLLQDLYGKIQVARSSHIFPRGSQVLFRNSSILFRYCLK